MNTVLKTHGGKSYLAAWINEHFPDHTHYVEPFCGGLNVLFHQSGEGRSEVANDINKELMNFWRILQRDPEALISRLNLTPFAKREFQSALELTDDPIERARRFFIRNRQSRQGLGRDFATLSRNRVRRGMNEQVSAMLSAVDELPGFVQRLHRVVLLCDDACCVIRQQDGPKTLFYCDPPYLPETRTVTSAYDHEMDRADHERLLHVLIDVTGKVALSGYPNELYDKMLAGWRTSDYVIDKKSSSAKKKPKVIERIWLNF